MKLTYCLVGFTLLFSSIFMHLIKDNTKFSNFINTLNDKQKKIYKDIILERLKIYSIGIAVGLLLGVFYYLIFSVCFFIFVFFSFFVFVFLFWFNL